MIDAWSRRQVAMAPLALAASPALAAQAAPVRPAALNDIPRLVPLLLAEARARAALDPAIWLLAPDAEAKIAESLHTELGLPANPGPRTLWLVAETGGRIVGCTHSMIVPPPSIYAVPTSPGLLLDDCFTVADAPSGTAGALLSATEGALAAAGAGGMIASCPTGGAWSGLYASHGYEPVTNYMGKADFVSQGAAGIRPAVLDDIPGVVALSGQHRVIIAELNPRFWPTHPQADARFAAYMKISLKRTDRDFMVAGPSDALAGYIIAQPASPLHVPAGHDLPRLGTIDDFYSTDFAEVASVAGTATSRALLAAAEAAFAGRGYSAAIAVCPAKWASKTAVLEAAGYRTAKVWLLKRA